MRGQRSFAVILVEKRILFREGLARILRAANFRILASVSSADDLRLSKQPPHLRSILLSGDDFDIALERSHFQKPARGRTHCDCCRPLSAERLRHSAQARMDTSNVSRATDSSGPELVMMGETIFPQAFLSFLMMPIAPSGRGSATVRNLEPILVATEDATTALSPQEKVMRCLIEVTQQDIARKIDITEATVKSTSRQSFARSEFKTGHRQQFGHKQWIRYAAGSDE
jgi:two-component system nitrate/nitrite response regulator NarL